MPGKSYATVERWGFAALSPQQISELDPPVPDDNYRPIYPPDSFPKRIYHQEGSDEPSIQKAMEMEDQMPEFMYLMRLIRSTAKAFTNINLPYSMQGWEVLRRIKKEVLNRAPVFYNYEHEWPIMAYLRLAMKTRRYEEASTRSSSSASTRNIPRITSRSATWTEDHRIEDSDKDVIYLDMADHPTDALTALLGDPAARAHSKARSSVEFGLPPSLSTSSQRTSNSEVPSRPDLSLSVTRSTTKSSDVLPHSGTSRPTRTASHGTDTIAARLRAFSLPHSDIKTIRRVLRSLGVHNVRYLRVLGRMKTRNTWLKQLRTEGRLTEIQVRVSVVKLRRSGNVWRARGIEEDEHVADGVACKWEH
ncbi:hypothetical protein C2E23DRAFT_828355 [Lenzites betulinus]|nr:hypothetical protein C2E23DRAFT_828355 [Lenzites betulinus]